MQDRRAAGRAAPQRHPRPLATKKKKKKNFFHSCLRLSGLMMMMMHHSCPPVAARAVMRHSLPPRCLVLAFWPSSSFPLSSSPPLWPLLAAVAKIALPQCLMER